MKIVNQKTERLHIAEIRAIASWYKYFLKRFIFLTKKKFSINFYTPNSSQHTIACSLLSTFSSGLESMVRFSACLWVYKLLPQERTSNEEEKKNQIAPITWWPRWCQPLNLFDTSRFIKTEIAETENEAKTHQLKYRHGSFVWKLYDEIFIFSVLVKKRKINGALGRCVFFLWFLTSFS